MIWPTTSRERPHHTPMMGIWRRRRCERVRKKEGKKVRNLLFVKKNSAEYNNNESVRSTTSRLWEHFSLLLASASFFFRFAASYSLYCCCCWLLLARFDTAISHSTLDHPSGPCCPFKVDLDINFQCVCVIFSSHLAAVLVARKMWRKMAKRQARERWGSRRMELETVIDGFLCAESLAATAVALSSLVELFRFFCCWSPFSTSCGQRERVLERSKVAIGKVFN